jgi:hypothetical protein
VDASRVLKLAAQGIFDVFASTAVGTRVVGRQQRTVWINEGCRRLLPVQGHAESDFVGRPV